MILFFLFSHTTFLHSPYFHLFSARGTFWCGLAIYLQELFSLLFNVWTFPPLSSFPLNLFEFLASFDKAGSFLPVGKELSLSGLDWLVPSPC